MERYRAAFGIYYGGVNVNRDFKVRNHVDLLVATAFSRHQRKLRGGERPVDVATPAGANLCTVIPRQPWDSGCFVLIRRAGAARALTDSQFEEFPHAFTKLKEQVFKCRISLTNVVDRRNRY